jgi:hypothetical protein
MVATRRGCYALRMRPALPALLALLSLAPTACGDKGGQTGSGTATETSSSSGSSDSGTVAPTTTSSLDTSSSTTIDPPEGECIFWADECGPEQKCEPYTVHEGQQWPDEIRCCPAVENPDLVGEQCDVIDYNGSCLDSCDRGAFCVLDDPDMLRGYCRAYCQPGTNSCPPDQTCKSFFELLPDDIPTVPLCMDQCDPLVQDCIVPNWLCIPDSPTESGQSGFICVSPPPSAPVGLFDACALANQCEAGLACIPGDKVPGCTFMSCCTSYCSLSEGDTPCVALDGSLGCVDWMSPDPTWSDVGVCAIPE